jgi:hypothetical protein
MKNLRKTRVVTYRRYGIPALILEGKWLTEKYRLVIGDLVDIDYQPRELRLKKNIALSLKNQKRRELKFELEDNTDAKQSKNENINN